MPTWAAISFQNASSPVMEQLIFFHNHVMTILILVMTVVSFKLLKAIINININKNLLESQSLELFWTLVPGIILLFVGFPSIRILYMIDEVFNPMLTLKTIGHQWYWSYEYSDFSKNICFHSFMTPSSDVEVNQFRLLDTDNRTIIPFNTQGRNLISSADVIHSWAVPALGVKADAIPGRLNQVSFYINNPGLFYGQCPEICGANHSFMPITVEATLTNSFKKWVHSFK